MTLFLSVPEALSQHPQAEPLESMRQPWTIPLIDAAGKSQGYRQAVNLRPGLGVLIDDYTLQSVNGVAPHLKVQTEIASELKVQGDRDLYPYLIP